MKLLTILLALACHALHAAERPNVLIIMADDCTHSDLPLYGGQNAHTPNIDKFATQSLTFNRAYLAEAMCQPCRSELFTGQFPMRNGCAWNHSASRPGVKSMPHLLRESGYRVGIAGKIHVKPDNVYPFDKIAGFDPNCVRDPTRPHDIDPALQFMKADDPFCLVVALVDPHVPWVMGDASKYPPKKIKLPPNIADTPVTRDSFSRYLAEITYMDGQVGELLAALDATGKTSDTLVLFTSEQGAQFPGCKWTNWDTGVHTALIARWPGKIAEARRTDAIVQYADVLPTLLDLTNSPLTVEGADGKSFAAVLHGETETHREFAYGIHNNLPEGPPYPIRTITNGEFRYLRNLTPDELYIEKHVMGISGNGKLNNLYWQTWIFNAEANENTYRLVKRYMQRPAEQLYHTATDPYEMVNLTNDPAHAEIKKHLSSELDKWLTIQGDPGAEQDTTKALNAARKGKHLFTPPALTEG
jgi:N-sulfoglucosamine sulfohydrolase